MTQVETRYGRVEGIARGGVLQFRGLPYAAAPVGDLRWRAPRPPRPWSGVRQAGGFGAIAPQAPNAISLLPRPPAMELDEDCLTLNVYTPAPGGEPRPVLVWIHGGGFTGGSGRTAWYDGTSFAQREVVVVTINYRLGALGFLDLGDDFPGSANCGLLDQVAALEWVRDNIAAFGGDPKKVTIFGESAGGMSVATLLGTPAAAGLFRRAVAQSGAASNVSGRERAAEVAERMRARLGGLDGLLSASWQSVLDAQAEVAAALGTPGSGLAFQPSVDGTVLPRPPLDAVRAGSAGSVDLLTGTNRDEWTLFVLGTPGGNDLDEGTVLRRLDRAANGAGRALYDAYREQLGTAARPLDVWIAAESDRVFRMPAIRLASAQSERTENVWMYLFTWESPALDGALRSCHALEIPFVWNTLHVPGTEQFTGAGRPGAAELAGRMHASWAGFAATGEPGWERYERGRRATRVFGDGDPAVEDDPMGAARRLWGA